MAHSICNVNITYEDDVITARQRARLVAELLGFERQDQTRISTAVSEVVRVFVNHNTPSQVQFFIEGETVPQILLISIGRSCHSSLKSSLVSMDIGGVPLSSDWDTATVSASRLMDQCEVRGNSPLGPTIWLKKILTVLKGLITTRDLDRLKVQVGRLEPQNPIEEVRHQNQELLRTLEELHERQQELSRVNGELEDTNRGVVALYAELDEKADHLRRADEMKSRFLSDMSHEFRTPLNAILALSQLLLDHSDGDLTSEQEKQVSFIQKGGRELLELVNDLLDLAKIEAGKIVVRPTEFTVSNLFSTLRGMLRPLLATSSTTLVLEQSNLPTMRTDEGKVSQIIRNLISNAIKFTQRGEVRVTASLTKDSHAITFSVTDTGIGIAQEDQARIFDDFSQLDNPIQRQVKGTGLGLPLCRKLSELLGGSISVTSRPGIGSTFSALIPVIYVADDPTPNHFEELAPVQPEKDRFLVLVVEDEPETRLLYDKYLRQTTFQPIPVGSVRQAREALRRHPEVVAIVLDVVLPDEMAWHWLAELKGHRATKHIPVFIVSSSEDVQKGLALGADDYGVKPVQRSWLLKRLEGTTAVGRDAGSIHSPVMLLIDDQDADRYLLSKLASETGFAIVETGAGEEGLKIAHSLTPSLILLDLNMPGMDGFEVLGLLQEDPRTQTIPVIVVTSLVLTKEQIVALRPARAILRKSDLSLQTWQKALAEAGCAKRPASNETIHSDGI